MNAIIKSLTEGKGRVCKTILDDLPQWFGIEEAKDRYVCGVEETLFLVALDSAAADNVVGFLSLKDQTDATFDIYVMGVSPDFHHQGLGTKLVKVAEEHALAVGKSFLSVKTLAPENPDPNYAITRSFYLALGFKPVEVFPTLWGENNPCLLMIKEVA